MASPETTPTVPVPQFPKPGSSSEYTRGWMDGWRAAWLLIDLARGEAKLETRNG